jgi:8-hydroxy-5-deazaflavin:NADPH oxidoreductase
MKSVRDHRRSTAWRTLTRTVARPWGIAAIALTLAVSGAWPEQARSAGEPSGATTAAPLKIGIVGSGHMGGSLAMLWVRAGHEVMLSSRHPQELTALARSLGPRAHVGTPREAAAFGDVVLISIQYGALPEVGRELRSQLTGKIVLDTCNPYPERDGPMALEARRKGTGVASSEYLPGARLVRAFNAIDYQDLHREAHRAGQPIAIPLAADDAEALTVAARLVRDAGFEPVVVGGLAQAHLFDVGSPVYVQLLTAAQLRARLGLDSGARPR